MIRRMKMLQAERGRRKEGRGNRKAIKHNYAVAAEDGRTTGGSTRITWNANLKGTEGSLSVFSKSKTESLQKVFSDITSFVVGNS